MSLEGWGERRVRSWRLSWRWTWRLWAIVWKWIWCRGWGEEAGWKLWGFRFFPFSFMFYILLIVTVLFIFLWPYFLCYMGKWGQWMNFFFYHLRRWRGPVGRRYWINLFALLLLDYLTPPTSQTQSPCWHSPSPPRTYQTDYPQYFYRTEKTVNHKTTFPTKNHWTEEFNAWLYLPNTSFSEICLDAVLGLTRSLGLHDIRTQVSTRPAWQQP